MLVKNLKTLLPSRFLLIGFLGAPLLAAQQPIGRTSATEVQVSGAVDISHGETVLGNGSAITAGDQAVKITLQRGGSLRLCSTSSVAPFEGPLHRRPGQQCAHLDGARPRGDRGNYAVGTYSDVLLTPDLRILISGRERLTCAFGQSPGGYLRGQSRCNGRDVTVTSQLEGGAYRVLPDQRVNFQHGSLREVVDHEPEPCGCPAVPVTSVASAGATTANPAPPGRPVGGPSSTASDTAFPIAESEGLAAPPAPRATPVVPPGETHAQVTVPLSYDGENPAPAPAAPPRSGRSSPHRPGSHPFHSATRGRLCTADPVHQQRRPLPSHRPFLFQNLWPIGGAAPRTTFLPGRSYNRL